MDLGRNDALERCLEHTVNMVQGFHSLQGLKPVHSYDNKELALENNAGNKAA